jgi:hypothetical protein
MFKKRRIVIVCQATGDHILALYCYFTHLFDCFCCSKLLCNYYYTVEVLTMSMVNPDQILLRFQHVMDRTEDEEPIVISLQVSLLHCKKG